MSNPRNTLYSSANSSTSTLRPRNPRLISYGDDEIAPVETTSNVRPSSIPSSRVASPASHTHTRSVAAAEGRTYNPSQAREISQDATRRASNGLWDSWSQVQGIASTILGSGSANTGNNKNAGSFKSPAWMKQDRTYTSGPSTQSWGPKSKISAAPGPNAIEERQALVQAKRREALLISPVEENRGTPSRFKRKDSDSSISTKSPGTDIGPDALVYRHKVQPNDTLAGVMIKYSCQPEVFRKVNRFWPNDNIQTRRQVLVPVDACSLRGRKIEAEDSLDLLSEEVGCTRKRSDDSSAAVPDQQISVQEVAPAPTTPNRVASDDEDYRHDSWVRLPSFPHATEILRIPRQTLGYFPPARRKSNHHLFSESATSSPRTSFDTLRHPPSHAAQQAQLYQQSSVSLNSSPVRRPRLSTATSRQRSSSTISTTSTTVNAQNHFITALNGPGGVGTLRGLRTEISRPGPADDSLNQRFAKYLPDVGPPIIIEDREGDVPTLSKSFAALNVGLSVPRMSSDSARSGRSSSRGPTNSSNALGGVENWVKKIASARPGVIRTASERTITGSSGMDVAGIGIGGETGLGDLIELESSIFDDDSAANRNDHGDRSTGFKTPSGAETSQKDENLLNERFPIRGRVTRAYRGNE